MTFYFLLCENLSKGRGKGWGQFGKGKGGHQGDSLGQQKGWSEGEFWKVSKGPKGGDKGTMKGGDKGTTKRTGYQGTCWNCRQVGHKANEGKCGGKGVHGLEVGGEEANGKDVSCMELGGMWTLGCVGVENPPGLGRSEICVVEGKRNIEMQFQVSGVRKALGAVWRICDSGNLVQFGPRSEDCFIKNLKSEEKIPMRREGRSYVVDLLFEGGKQGKFTVDSAAEESACPWEWGEEFGCKRVKAGEGMKLINASGGVIEHWGSRNVQFSTF